MFFSKSRWVQWLSHSSSAARRRSRSRRGLQRLLHAEELESRFAPATFTWTGLGLNPNWSLDANWVNNQAPSGDPAALEDLVFPDDPAVIVRSTRNDLLLPTFNSITISGSAYSLGSVPGREQIKLGKPDVSGSGDLRVGVDAVSVAINLNVELQAPAGGRQFFTIDFGADLTINGQLTGTAAVELTKEGVGTLRLTGDNSGFLGPITIDNFGGIVNITHVNALGGTSAGTTVGTNSQLQVENVTGAIQEALILNGPGIINDGALLNVSGNNIWAGNIALDSNSTIGASLNQLTITGQIGDLNAGHNLTKEGPGELIFAPDYVDPQNPTGPHRTDNTYRGTTTINEGILTIRAPKALGAEGTSLNGTIVSVPTNKLAMLQIDDPTGVGFTVLDEHLTLNGPGVGNIGALTGARGALNNWAGTIVLGSPEPLDFSFVNIGVQPTRTLTVSGVIEDRVTDFPLDLRKVGTGKLIFNNRNTYDGFTTVTAGTLNIRDSQSLGLGGISSGTSVSTGAVLELEVDTGLDPHGRDLAQDSISSFLLPPLPQLGLLTNESLTISGTGIAGQNAGALHSISGINEWLGSITLAGGTAGIGVNADPIQSGTEAYFTDDYSLTVSGNISGGSEFHKLGLGHLILPFSNTYIGATDIQQGWVTIGDELSLGGSVFGADTVQPGTRVRAGAALHFRAQVTDGSFNLLENLVLSGTGIAHPFGLISGKGAIMSLGGNNSVGGPVNDRTSDIKLDGNAGIGVELLGPDTISQLTITASMSDFNGVAGGGITKLGSRRLLLQGDGTYSGAVNINEGVMRIQNDTALGTATSGTVIGPQVYTTTTTTVAPGIREQQSLEIGGIAGTFTLTFNGATTATALNAESLTLAADIQSALNALSTVSGAGGSVTVSRAKNIYTITFGGAFVGVNQPQLTRNIVSGAPVVTPRTLVDGDGAALELEVSNPYNSGGVSAGLAIWNEHLVLDSPGSTLFDDAPVIVRSNDHMWRGPISLRRDSTIDIQPSARLNLFGVIDDNGLGAVAPPDLTFAGGGQLALAGTGTFRGTMHVKEGVLVLRNSLALGATGFSERQTIAVSPTSTGTFTLTFNNQTTAALPAEATAIEVQNALNGLASIQDLGGVVSVSKAGNLYNVVFGGNLFGLDQAPITATGIDMPNPVVGTLTDGAGGTVVADGAALEIEGSLTVAGEPLVLQGQGSVAGSQVPQRWFSEGPAPINNGQTAGNMSVTGRVTGVAVDPTDANVIYISTAGGGAWKTKNGGLTWQPLFDIRNGTAEVQEITVTGTTGNFTLSFNGETTAPLPFNATALQVQSALNSLPTIGGLFGSVIVNQTGNVYTVTFAGNLADLDVAPLIPDLGGIASVNTLTEGQRPNGSPEVQKLLVAAGATGTFRLTFNGDTTGDISFLPQAGLAQAIENALNLLPSIIGTGPVAGFVNVTANSSNNAFTITFLGGLQGLDVSLLTDNSASVTLSTSANGTFNNDFLYGGAIAIAPTDPTTIYFGTGETNNSPDSFYGTGVYKSVDSGRTWTLLIDDAPIPKNPNAATDNNLRYDGVSNPLYGLGVSKIVVDPRDSDVIYVATGDQTSNEPNTAIAPVPGVYRYDATEATSKWFNLTAVASTSRTSVPGQTGATNPNRLPGPDDDFRFDFAQSNATWTDLAMVYTDIDFVLATNNPGSGVPPNFFDEPVLYAALGTGGGSASNAVFRIENPGTGGAGPRSGPNLEPIWAIGNPRVPVSEVQQIRVTPWSAGGTYQLDFRGARTPLAPPGVLTANASAFQIQTALNNLSTISGPGGFVTVVQNAASDVNVLIFDITFGGLMANTNQPQITAVFTNPPVVTTSTLQEGGGVDDRAVPAFPAGANGGGTNANIKIAVIAGGNPNVRDNVTIYASVANPANTVQALNHTLKAIYVSTTGGEAWGTVASTPPNYLANQGFYNSTMVAVNTSTVYVGGNEVNPTTHLQQIFRTTNSGGLWTDLSVDADSAGLRGPHTSQHAMAVDSSSRLIVGGDGGVWRLNPTTNEWSDLTGNLAISQFNGVAAHPTDLNIAFGGSRFNGTQSFDGSLDWTLIDDFDGGQVHINPMNPNLVYHVANASQLGIVASTTLRRSTTGGTAGSFAQLNLLDGPAFSAPYLPFVIDNINTARLVVGGGANGAVGGGRRIGRNTGPTGVALQESLDNGTTWRNLTANLDVINGPTPFPVVPAVWYEVTALALATFQGEFQPDPGFSQVTDKGANIYDPDTMYILVSDRAHGVQRVVVTKNHGVSWEERTGTLPAGGSIVDIQVDPSNRDTVYVARNTFDGLGRKVFKSTNGARSWTDITNDLPNLPVNKIVPDPRNGDLYVGTDSGVWLLRSQATSWELFGGGMANVQVKDLELNVNTNTLLAGTYGRSMYRFFLNEGQANAGALRAVSGTSTWTGPVFLNGTNRGDSVHIGAGGTQGLQNGLATAQITFLGPVTDLVVNGNQKLVKVGQGTVVLSGENTYGGMTEVREGVLVAHNAQALGTLTLDVQTVTVTGSSGTFTLTFNGQTTGALDFDATAAEVQTALNALSTIRGVGGFVYVTQNGNVYTVSFAGTLTGLDQPNLTAAGAGAVVGQVSDGAGITLEQQEVTVTGTSGTFTLTFNDRTTSALAFNATANQVRDALNALPTIGGIGGVVTVTKIGNVYRVTFAGVLAGIDQPLLTAAGGANAIVANAMDASNQPLHGAGATVVDPATTPEVQTVTVNGSAGTTFTLTFNGQTTAALDFDATAAEVQAELNLLSTIGGIGGVVNVTQNGNVYTVNFLGTLSGLDQPLLTATGTGMPDPVVDPVADGSGVLLEKQTVTVAGAGTFTLTFNGQTTGPLSAASTAADVATQLNGLSTIGGIDGFVIVTKTGNIFTVAFAGTLAGFDQPQMTATGNATVLTVQQAARTAPVLELQADLDLEPIQLNGDGYTLNTHFTGALRNRSGNNRYTGHLILNTNSTIGVDSGQTLTIQETGTISDGGQTLNLTKELTGTLVLAGVNNYDGSTLVNQGILNIQNGSALGSGGTDASGTRVLDGAQLQIQGSVTVANEHLRISGTGIFGSGALQSVGGVNRWQGPVLLAQDAGFSPATIPPTDVVIGVLATLPGEQLIIEGVIDDNDVAQGVNRTLGLSKVNTGRLALSNTNLYGGVTTIFAGALAAQNAGALGTTGNGTDVRSGAALELDGDRNNIGASIVYAAEPVTLNGNGTPEVQAVTLTGAGGPFILTFNGQSTALLPANATASQVQAALNALTSIPAGGSVNVVQNGNVYLVTFVGTLGTSNISEMTAQGAAISTVKDGALGALQNVTGNNTWTGTVTLQTSSSIGVNPNTQLTITGTIQDPTPFTVPAPGLTKVNTGILILPNANTYTGKTSVNAGILNIRHSGALGAGTPEVQRVTVGGIPSPFTLTFNGQETVSLPFNVTAAQMETALNNLMSIGGVGGFVTVSQSGNVYTVTFGGSLAQVNVTAMTATASAATVLVATLRDGPDITVVASGATLQLQGGITVSSELLTLNGPGFNNAGALENFSGTNTWARTITLGSNASIGATANTLIINQSIVDNGSNFGVTKVGPGTLDYAGGVGTDNTYTGLTQVNTGILSLNKSAGASPFSGNLTIGDGIGIAGNAVAIWQFSNEVADTATVVVRSDGLLNLNSRTETLGTLRILDGSATTGNTGRLTIHNLEMTGGFLSTVLPSSQVILDGTVTATSSDVGPATLNGGGTLQLGGADRTFTVTEGPKDTDLLVSERIDNLATPTIGITKAGLGTMEINIDTSATYVGVTTVTDGRLLVNGAGRINDVVVPGGTLGGTGTVGVITGTGGTINPGTTTGILHSGNVTFDTDTTFHVDLDSVGLGHDQLDVQGNIDITGSNLAGTIAPILPIDIGNTFTIIQSTGLVIGEFVQGSGIFISGQKFGITYNDHEVILTRQKNEVDLIVTSPPNPSVFGESVDFIVEVNPETGASGIPTGQVTFTLDSTITRTFTLVDGKATWHTPPPALAIGNHTITVTYTGDDQFNSAATDPLTPHIHVVQKANSVVAIGSSKNPSTFGESVTFTATVTAQSPGVGLPTGNFTFIVDGVSQPVLQLNGSGQATLTLSTLTVGFHSITGSYAGDGNFNAGVDLLGVLQQVQQAQTQVEVTSSQNPSVFGQPLTFTARVTALPPGNGIPSGTVEFFAGDTSLGTRNLDNGEATFTTTAPLPAGTYVITVDYLGTNNFASSSGTLTQVVDKAQSTTVLESSVNASVFGQPVTFTATVTPVAPGFGIPAGTVRFTIDSTTQDVILDATGKATLTTSSLSVGTHMVTAEFLGNDNIDSSTSNTITQTVDRANTTTTVVSSLNPSRLGQSVTFTATVTANAPGAGTPVGTVIFTIDSTTQFSRTLNAQGKATLTLANLPVGTHSVVAVYELTTNFNSSTSSTLDQIVNEGRTTTSLVASPAATVFGQNLTFTATVQPEFGGFGTPTGTVTFRDGSTELGTVALNASGVAVFTTNTLTAGPPAHSITATYNGNTTFATSTSNTVSRTVGKANTQIAALAGPLSSTFGQTVTFTTTVTAVAPGAGIPTGKVSFFRAATTFLGQADIDASGNVSFQIANLSVGSHQITARYDGDTNFNQSATTPPFAHNVIRANSTITLSGNGSPSQSVFGQAVVVASVVPVPTTGAGTVTFFINGSQPIATVNLDANGTATLPGTALSPGTYNITASYSGDANVNPSSTAGPLTHTVSRANTTTTVTTSQNPAVFGQPLTFTATVAAIAPGAGIPNTGSVAFVDTTTGNSLGTVSVNGAGQATLMVSNLSVGNHTITATYSGNGNYTGSVGTLSPDQTVTVVGTTTTITSSLNPSLVSQPVTFTVQVQANAPSGAVPTGTVTFTIDGVAQPSLTLNAQGQASFTTSSLSQGTHSIGVSYVANSVNFTSSAATPLNQVVNPNTTTIATGTDFGATPHVKVFNGISGAERFSFFAYATNVTTGVRVAVGDVTGDGVPDILTALGPGSAPHVKVFNGATGAEHYSFYAYVPNFTGGVFIATGFVDGDQFADIITSVDAGGGPHVKVLSGANLSQIHSFFAYAPFYTGGVRIAAGDVNGDGRADIITGTGPGGGPHVKVLDGTNLAQLDSYFAYAPNFTGGLYVGAGDINGDGRADVITGAGRDGGPHVRVRDVSTHQELASFLAYNPAQDPPFITPGGLGGLRVAAYDFDSDGKAEIVTIRGRGRSSLLRVIDPRSLAVKMEFFVYDPGFLGGAFVGAGR